MSNLNKENMWVKKCGMTIYYEYRFICKAESMPAHLLKEGARHDQDRIALKVLVFVLKRKDNWDGILSLLTGKKAELQKKVF